MRFGGPDPRWGEEKIKRKFAWLPYRMASGEYVWWEWIEVTYHWLGFWTRVPGVAVIPVTDL